MLDLFWNPVSYEAAINELALLHKDKQLDQKAINFTLKRICRKFNIEKDVDVSMDILWKTLELLET